MTSLADVARRSGVSVSTASRALSAKDAHLVNGETRKRVLAVSTELGFRPNALAQGLRGQYGRTIGVIVHDIRDPYFAECARGVSDAAIAHGFLPVVCNSERRPATEIEYVEMMRAHKAAGILFVGGGLDNTEYRRDIAALTEAIRDYGGAVVALGPRWDSWPAETPDNRGGAVLATEHLIGLGHCRIAFIDGPAGLRTSEDRRGGYAQTLESAGIPVDPGLIRSGGFSSEGGVDAMAHLCDSGGEFTAVFASNDPMAVGCLQELHRRGVQVPEQVSLVGFDDVPITRWVDPPLTTVVVPMAEIGKAGVERLLGLLDSPDADSDGARVNEHGCELVVRGSSGPPPAPSGGGDRR